MSEETLPLYARELANIRPWEIHGYPSALAELAHGVLRSDERQIRPRAVITSGETLSDGQREAIESAFGCDVRDQYGMAENVAWISQCEEGIYHVHPEYGHVETVRDGRPVRGEPGEVLGSGFINEAMPLIRYRVGDTLTLESARTCACGRAFETVSSIVGRTDDVLYSVDGRPLGRLGFLFAGLSRVKQGQIVQIERDRLEVRLVADGDIEGDLSRLTVSIREVFGAEMRVEFRCLESLPRTATGKLRYQRNLMDEARRDSS
jgi:phenylacetate-CoA ligase